MWEQIGTWLKDYGGSGLALVGSLLTGNVSGAVAAGQSLVSIATGTTDPAQALKQLQDDPQTRLKLAELAQQNESEIRTHLAEMARMELESKKADLSDAQASHAQTQETIRNGDNSEDKDIRMVRPTMAKQSWYATLVYTFVVVGSSFTKTVLTFEIELAMILSAPAWAYLGLRSWDKWGKR